MSRTIALGFFDGVHIGHGELLKKALEVSRTDGSTPSVLSFDVHPDTLVSGTTVPLISDCRDREEIIRRCYGINDVIIIHFSRTVMAMPWDAFLEDIVSRLEVTAIVCGYDFTFGHMGKGNAERLKEWCGAQGIGCHIMPEVKLDGITVSSTYIRTLIENGDMADAARFLGHPHCISDTVHTGYQIGTSIGSPTINLNFSPGVIVPRHGVYATMAVLEDGSEHVSVTNIGVRPTFGSENGINIESHIVNWSGNLYNKQVRLDFYGFIREERRFDNPEQLALQIQSDIKSANTILKG